MASGTAVVSALTSVANVARGFEPVPNEALAKVRGAVGAVGGAHLPGAKSTHMLGVLEDCWAANLHRQAQACFEVGWQLQETAADYQNTDAANENQFDPVPLTTHGHVGLAKPI